MSSLLFDSAIGMGGSGSDSRSSIEQPIIDREVISIGGSSSKDTRRGASDSESSSSERVRASLRTSRGASRPRGRVRPSTTIRELVLVTVILPLSSFGGVKRGSNIGDMRMSPCVRHN